MLYMDLYLYLDELLFINAPLDIFPTPLPSGPHVWHTEHKTMTTLWVSHILQGSLGCQYSVVLNTTQGSEQSSSWGRQAQKNLWRKKLLTQSITVGKGTLMPILDTECFLLENCLDYSSTQAVTPLPCTDLRPTGWRGWTALLSHLAPAFQFIQWGILIWREYFSIPQSWRRSPGHTWLTARSLSIFFMTQCYQCDSTVMWPQETWS